MEGSVDPDFFYASITYYSNPTKLVHCLYLFDSIKPFKFGTVLSGKQSCAPHKYVEFTHNFAIGNLQNVRKLSLYRLIIIYHNYYIKNDGLSFVYVVSFFPKNHVIYLPQIPASFSLIIKLIETSFPRNFPWVDFNHALRFVEYSLFGKKSLNCDTIKPQTLIALGKSGYEHFSWLHLFCEDAELQNGRLNHSFVKIRLNSKFSRNCW